MASTAMGVVVIAAAIAAGIVAAIAVGIAAAVAGMRRRIGPRPAVARRHRYQVTPGGTKSPICPKESETLVYHRQNF